MKQKYTPLLVLFCLGFFVYMFSFGNDFVWDDEQFIVKNQYIRSVAHVPDIFTTNTIAGAGHTSNYYRPLTTLSFLVDYHIWGLNPFGFHLTNTLLHILSGVWLYLLLKELRIGSRASFLISAVFLVHPIHTEAVVYMNSRGDSHYTFWLLLGLLMFVWSLKDKDLEIAVGKQQIRLSPGVLVWWSVCAYGLSILAKEIGIAGLGMFVLIVLIYGLGWGWKNIFSRKWKQMVGLGGVLLVAVGYVLLRLTVLSFGDGLNFYGSDSIYGSNLMVRIYTFGRVFWEYMSWLVWPYPLHMERMVPVFTGVNLWFIGMILVNMAVLVLAYWDWWQNNRATIFMGWGWFWIMIFPVSGVVPINGLLYEHWLYMPMVGFFVTVLGVWRLLGRPSLKSKWLLVGVGVWLGILSVMTIRQNYLWRNPVVFYEYTLQFSESARLYNNLGMAYEERGWTEEALEAYESALGLADWYPQTYHNMANLYRRMGDVQLAEKHYEKAIEIDPSFYFAYWPLVEIALEQGDRDRAITYLSILTELFPEDIELRFLLLDLKTGL